MFGSLLKTILEVKMAPIGTRTRNCFSRVGRFAGLSISGRDTYYTYVVQFALRSLYSALNVIPLQFAVNLYCLLSLLSYFNGGLMLCTRNEHIRF